MLPCCSLVIGNVEQSRYNIPRLIRATENESSRWITPPPLPAGFGDGRPNGYTRCAVNVACFLMQPSEWHNKNRNKEPRQPDRPVGTVLIVLRYGSRAFHMQNLQYVWTNPPIGRTLCPTHSTLANNLSSLPVEPFGNSVTLPIGGKGDTSSMSPPRRGNVV